MAFQLWSLLVAILGLLWFWRKRQRQAHKEKLEKLGLKELPGPKGYPLVGNMFELGYTPHTQYSKWAEEYGDIYQVQLADKIMIIVSDPKLAKEIFSVEPTFTGRDFLPQMQMYEEEPGLGILSSEGERWEVHRRFLLRQMRDFGFGKSSMETLIMDELNEVIETYKTQVGVPLTGIRDKLRLSLVNSLWSILTSQRFKQDDPELSRLANNISKKFNDMVTKILILLLMPNLSKYLIPESSGYRALRQVFTECKEKFQKTVSDRKKNFKEGELNDFIDVYLAEMKKYEGDSKSLFHGDKAERQLVVTLFDLFFAGSDTTASTLDWSILFLSKYPEVQKRFQQEIAEITGNSRRVSISDRPNMPYTLAMIDEILRFSTIVPDGLPHRVLGENKQFRGYYIPKDTNIQANIWMIHHSPKLWGDPENFKPERFMSPDGKKYIKSENVFAFQPGRRQCVGESLARDSIFLYLTNLFQQFNFEFDPKMEKIPGIEDSEFGFVRAPLPYSVILKERQHN